MELVDKRWDDQVVDKVGNGYISGPKFAVLALEVASELLDFSSKVAGVDGGKVGGDGVLEKCGGGLGSEAVVETVGVLFVIVCGRVGRIAIISLVDLAGALGSGIVTIVISCLEVILLDLSIGSLTLLELDQLLRELAVVGNVGVDLHQHGNGMESKEA